MYAPLKRALATGLTFGALLAGVPAAFAAPFPSPLADPLDVLPDRTERPAEWARQGEGRESPPAAAEPDPATGLPASGSRVAAIVTYAEAASDAFLDAEDAGPFARGADLYARGVAADGSEGPWVRARVTFRQPGRAILVADIGDYPAARLRLGGGASQAGAVETIAWKLTTPRFPDAVARDGESPPAAAPPPPPLASELADIGVVSRAEWGARATTCTSPETDWYRMAIHHTAGQQAYNGSVLTEVQLLQAYAMDSGEYCDVPYQFLVGFDGSLYEGRPLDYYSGATYNNNDGDIAVVFIGCYHPNSCPNGAGDAVTDAMMVWGGYLVTTLTDMWDIPRNDDSIRGHRDWPDNATACPGDYLHARLEELRNPVAPYAAGSASWGFALEQGVLRVPLHGQVSGWVDLTNTGTATWTPGVTNLGPLPRDAASPYQAADWASSTRAASVAAATAPGQVGRFPFSVTGFEVGTGTLSLAPVEEWVTWFADAPYGGGPAEGALTLAVEVYDASGDNGADSGSDSGADSGSDNGGLAGDSGAAGLPGRPESVEAIGCGCASSPRAGAGLAGMVALALVVARRRGGRGRGGRSRGGRGGERRSAEKAQRSLP